MNLVLIGYRATGKTTLARLLAERLDWAWIDADAEIERRAHKTIARIFAEEGEPHFRNLEAQVIAFLCKQGNVVIATGGGAPMRPESRKAMRDGGKVIWLKAEPDTILVRMTGDQTTASRRPSLTDKDPLEEILLLLEKREPVYRDTAHFEIDTEGKTPDQIADEILRMFGGPQALKQA